ncbi:MAG: PepSY-associated TM helix domain-containing protein [Methylocystis sp.]
MIVRGFWVWLHRWAGLTTAGFLILVGLTGSLLAFLPEINHSLTPELYPGAHGPELEVPLLVRRAESLVPSAKATGVYLGWRGMAMIRMEPRPGSPPMDFNYLHLDAVTGVELGRVNRGAFPRALGELMPFIYTLHYNLTMGQIGGWILGIVALVWTIDCFIAFYLTLPLPSRNAVGNFLSRWKTAWRIKWRASAYRINFDLHRAGGLWLWGVLLIFAWSSVSFNLNGFYTSATRLFIDIEQGIWSWPGRPAISDGRAPLDWEQAYATGNKLMEGQAQVQDFAIERPLALYFIRNKGVYEYRVRSSRDIASRIASTSIAFDAYTGEFAMMNLPTGWKSGNTVTSWLRALHTANVFGLPYKIFVSVVGLAITMLSITGVYIWLKKRSARLAHMRRTAPRPAPAE